MHLDLRRFYQAANPSKTLAIENEKDRKYYIDFSVARGSKTVEEFERTITRISPDEPTCQLFTGHIGCGKTTELLRLKNQLEKQGFHVVYCESSHSLVMADVDVTDILLAIARKVSESLEQAKISLQPRGFKALLQGAAKVLQTEIDVTAEASMPGVGSIKANTEGELSIGFGIGKITAKTKNSPELRSVLRQYLEPRTDTLLDAINKELLEPAITELKRMGKQGLVVIVDNLDRIDNSPKLSNRTQPEYLFIDRGDQLKSLKCHLVYTIPLVLMFSNDLGALRNRFGINPKVLPMVRVQLRDSRECEQGMMLLRQMILARAFPDIEPEQRLALVSEVFDSLETLDRLCRVSGGHVRNLLVLLFSCLQKEDPPLSRKCLEDVVRRERDALVRGVTDDEWELLNQLSHQHVVRGEEAYETLLRSMFVFEYQDDEGGWFGINPILAEARQLKV